MILKIGEPLTPAQHKVLSVAVDLSEAGRNIGFDSLPSVMIHEVYDAVEALKRERKMENLTGVPGETVNIPGDVMSTDERARRFKWAIAEYSRAHREFLRQADDLEKAQANVARMKREMENARGRVIELIGNTTYLDFHEALYWQFVEHGWDANENTVKV